MCRKCATWDLGHTGDTLFLERNNSSKDFLDYSEVSEPCKSGTRSGAVFDKAGNGSHWDWYWYCVAWLLVCIYPGLLAELSHTSLSVPMDVRPDLMF